MSFLRKLFGFSRPGQSAPPPAPALPQPVLDLVAQKDMGALIAWLKDLSPPDVEGTRLGLLVQAAAEYGWPPGMIDKLEIFGHYTGSRYEPAWQIAEKYVADEAADPDLIVIAACSLYYLCRFEEAYEFLLKHPRQDERLRGRADYALGAAKICWSMNRHEEMRTHIGEFLALAPDDAAGGFVAYSMYHELGDEEKCDQIRHRIQSGEYDLRHGGMVPACIELSQDNYQEGFRLLEARYTIDHADRFFNTALFELPRWMGENLHGETLLISAEQGLGDTIQMARYLPQVARLGAGRIVMESQPETLALLHYNFPDLPIVERKYGQAPALEFDRWVGMMSLPHYLGATAETIPGRAGYLRVPPETGMYWRSRVEELARGRRPRIGLAWSGRPIHRSDRQRSIPFEHMAAAIRDVDADFFALQTQVPELRPANLIDVSEEMITLADTAALIEAVDLVITVDTSVVHLAGAIGKEAWLLLPYRYEWRWGLSGEGNRWYDSVRVLRQAAAGDWASVLNDVFGARWHPRFPDGSSR